MDARLGGSYRDAIARYYAGTWLDYRLVWVRRGAMHFGYWDDGTRTHARSLVNMNRLMAEEVGLRRGERVLDAGCGVGGPARWVADTYGADVVGITLSAPQVRRARQAALRRGNPPGAGTVAFSRQDFTATTFPADSFDVVWAQESVCHVPNERKRTFLREAHRLLRPGGRLIVEDWFRRGRPYADEDEGLLRAWLSGWAIDDLATLEEFAEWTEAAGFGDLRRKDITARAHRSIRRLYLVTLPLYPGALLLRGLRLRTPVQHGNVRSALLHWRAYRRGLWFIATLAATKQP